MATQEPATPIRDNRTWWLAASIPMVAAILAAMPVIHLPLFYDDLLNNRIVEHLTAATVWLPTPGHTYYRPLFFFLYVILRDLPGGYPIVLMHAANILQHGINAFLIASLTYRITKDPLRGFISGLLFALYPFAFQDIASFASTTHLLSLNLILAGAHLYLNLIRQHRGHIFLHAALLTIALLSLLTHESAVLLGPLLILIHWTGEKPAASWRILTKRYMPVLVLDVVYLIAYPLINTQAQQSTGVSTSGLWEKALFALQGLTYPFASLHAILGEGSGTFLIMGGVCLLALMSFKRSKQEGSPWVFILGWGWFILCALVVILPLERDYVLHSPRLLYIPAAGIAFLWSLLLKRPRNTFRVTDSLVLTAIAGISLFALERDLTLLEKITSPVTAMQSITSIEDGDQIVFVNLPEYLVPEPPVFPIGVEFIPLMGPHLYIEELVWLNMNDPSLQAAAIEVPDLLRENTAFRQAVFAPSELDKITSAAAGTTHHIILTQAENNDIISRHTGSIAQIGDTAGSLAQIGPVILLDATWEEHANTLALTWQVTGEVSPFLVVFTHLVNTDGALIGQNDGPLLGVAASWLGLQAGDTVIEERIYNFSDGSLPGYIEIGLYDYTTGERLPVSLTRDGTGANDAFTLAIEGSGP